jgi:ATP-dependent Clp protease ATP-binding subunit ClpA
LQKEVENALGRLILEGKVRDGQTVTGDYDVKEQRMVFSARS